MSWGNPSGSFNVDFQHVDCSVTLWCSDVPQKERKVSSSDGTQWLLSGEVGHVFIYHLVYWVYWGFIYIYTCENIKQLLLGKARAYFLRHKKPCDIEKKSFWSHNIQDESWIPSHVCSILLFLLLMNPNRGLVTSPAWLDSSIYGTWIFCHARESKIKHTMIWYITYPLVN